MERWINEKREKEIESEKRWTYTQMIIYHLKPLTALKHRHKHALLPDFSEYLEMETTYNQPNNNLQ